MPDDEFRIRLYRAMDEFEKLIADHPEYLDDECRRELRRIPPEARSARGRTSEDDPDDEGGGGSSQQTAWIEMRDDTPSNS